MLQGLNDLTSIFSGVGNTPNPNGYYDPNTNPYGNTVSSQQVSESGVSDAGVLGNYDDQASWNQYLKILDASNQYNSAEAQKARDWNEYMRDTQVQSYMKQLKDAGINPILAVNSGYAGASYPSSAQAQAYSGTSPYSNSSRIDAAIIRAVGSIVGDIISSALGYSGKLGAASIYSSKK